MLGLEVYDLCDDFAARLLPGGEGAPIAEGFVVGLFLRLLRGLAVGRAGLPDECVLLVGHDRLHLPVVDMERSSDEGEAVGSSGLLLGGFRALAAFAAAGEQSGDHNACDDE